MPLLQQLIDRHANVDMTEREALVSLVREWHLLADTSFSDLVLWIPDRDGSVFWAGAQVRPNTGPTALEDDIVGGFITEDPNHPVTKAFMVRTPVAVPEHLIETGSSVGVAAVPIIMNGHCVAVVESHTNQMAIRAPGALEDTYLEVASVLMDMLWQGIFPTDPPSVASVSPKVGDGLIRTDEDGIVMYAAPNATSAYRQLGLTGDLIGKHLQSITRQLAIEVVVVDRSPKDQFGRRCVELAVDIPQASIRLRVLPLVMDGSSAGSVTLCVDTTALRERERRLVTKDATIHEIHHRVKNNLQTVAALLRLQSRRMTTPEARTALREAVSRVQSVSVVHEVLAQSYDEEVRFDAVADQLLEMVGEVAATTGSVDCLREGSFGLVPAEAATSLALALTELCQNAVEHGLGSSSGEVIIMPHRDGDQLTLDVINDGTPLPAGFSIDTDKSLGLSIVTTLVEELGGSFQLMNNPDGKGTTAQIVLDLHPSG